MQPDVNACEIQPAEVASRFFLPLHLKCLLQTNAILKQTLKGSRPNSYVIIEDSFPIEIYNGSYRALWKLHNGFMGGSLIIQPYYISDELILACALVFDPGSKKRNYIKEFESIL